MMRGPPLAPSTNARRPSGRAAITGLMLEAGRLPGLMKLAALGGRPYTLGWPGEEKSSIWLLSRMPAGCVWVMGGGRWEGAVQGDRGACAWHRASMSGLQAARGGRGARGQRPCGGSLAGSLLPGAPPRRRTRGGGDHLGAEPSVDGGGQRHRQPVHGGQRGGAGRRQRGMPSAAAGNRAPFAATKGADGSTPSL